LILSKAVLWSDRHFMQKNMLLGIEQIDLLCALNYKPNLYFP
jgi:hypothetical protein